MSDTYNETGELVEELLAEPIDRGALLRRAAGLGVSATALGALLGAPALAGAATPKRKIIAFSHAYGDVPVAGLVRNFAIARGKQVGYKVVTDNPHAKLDLQLADIETWIAQKIPAMVILPLEPAAMEAVAKRARAAGLLWITYATPMKNQDGAVLFPHTVSGNVLGKYAAEWINKNLGGEGEALIMTLSTLSFGHERTDPLEKWLKTKTKVKIVAKQDAVDQAGGLRVTEDVLQANPNLNIVLGINDDGALGGAQAFKNAGKDPAQCFIGGQDGTKDAFVAIKAGGYFKATAAVRLRDIGYACVDLPKRILETGKRGNQVINPVLISAENMKLLNEYLSDFPK